MIKINRFFVSPSGEWFDLADLHGVYTKGLVERFYPEAGTVDYMGYLLSHGWKKSMESSNNVTYLFCHDIKSPQEDFTLTKPQYIALKKYFGDKIVWKRSFVDPTNTEELTIDDIWFNYNGSD